MFRSGQQVVDGIRRRTDPPLDSGHMFRSQQQLVAGINRVSHPVTRLEPMKADLDRLGRGQHGLVTYWQLIQEGWSDAALRHAVATGMLWPVRKGVFRTAGTPVTREQTLLAAVLASRRTVVSHASAASAWWLREFPAPEGIDLLRIGSPPRLPGVVPHRTLHLPDADVTRHRGVPITTVARTLTDCCGLVSVAGLGRSVDDALRRGIVDLPRLVATVERIPRAGRRPSRSIREVLAERVAGYDPGGSDAELDVLRCYREHGRPLPVQQHRVRVGNRTYVLDYAFPEVRHGFEYQGVAFHGTPSALHDDSGRTRALQLLGWTLWPITSRTTANELLAISDAIFGHDLRSEAEHVAGIA